MIAVWEFVKGNLNPYPTAAFTAAVSGGRLARRSSAPTSSSATIDGELAVEVVESRRFSLRVAPIYSSLSSKLRSAETTEDEKQHVRQYVGRAKFFIDNINRRRATIQRIAECLVDRQRDYLVHGVQRLVPLTRAEVGELIGMHESTVSRATAEKYVMIPTGEVVPFSHFFTASLGIKDQIKRMIEAEDAAASVLRPGDRRRPGRRGDRARPAHRRQVPRRASDPARPPPSPLTARGRRAMRAILLRSVVVIGIGALVLAGLLYVASTFDSRAPTVAEITLTQPLPD